MGVKQAGHSLQATKSPMTTILASKVPFTHSPYATSRIGEPAHCGLVWYGRRFDALASKPRDHRGRSARFALFILGLLALTLSPRCWATTPQPVDVPITVSSASPFPLSVSNNVLVSAQNQPFMML